MGRSAASLLLVGLLMVVANEAGAQTVNAEAMAKQEEGFGLSLAGSLSLSSGNTNQTVAGAGLHTQYQLLYDNEAGADEDAPQFLRQRWFLAGKAAYQSTNDARVVSRSFAHARWTAMWWRRLGSEVFAQHQFSEFERLSARVLGGVGLRVVPLNLAAVKVSLGSGYMLEYERLTALDGESRPDSTIAHRWTNFLTVQIALADALTLFNTVYVQPRFDDFSDVRVLEDLTLDFALTDHLSLGSVFRVAHDSRPPEEVQSTDINFTQTIKLSF